MGNSGVDQLNDWKSKARLSNWTPRHYLLRSHESLSVCPLHSLEMPGSFALPTHPSMLSPLKHPVCWHSPHTTVSPWNSQHKFKGAPVLTLYVTSEPPLQTVAWRYMTPFPQEQMTFGRPADPQREEKCWRSVRGGKNQDRREGNRKKWDGL